MGCGCDGPPADDAAPLKPNLDHPESPKPKGSLLLLKSEARALSIEWLNMTPCHCRADWADAPGLLAWWSVNDGLGSSRRPRLDVQSPMRGFITRPKWRASSAQIEFENERRAWRTKVPMIAGERYGGSRENQDGDTARGKKRRREEPVAKDWVRQNANGASAQRLISLSFPRMMILGVSMGTTVVCDPEARDKARDESTDRKCQANAGERGCKSSSRLSCQERQANLLS